MSHEVAFQKKKTSDMKSILFYQIQVLLRPW